MSDFEHGLQGRHVADGFHASGPTSQLADRLRAPQQEFGHDGRFGFVDAHPFVDQMAVFGHAAAARDLDHRRHVPQVSPSAVST